MDEIAPEYDVVVLGTGLLLPRHSTAPNTDLPPRPDRVRVVWVRSSQNLYYQYILSNILLSSVLSVKGNKVLHIDRNDHYGGYADQQSSPQLHSGRNS